MGCPWFRSLCVRHVDTVACDWSGECHSLIWFSFPKFQLNSCLCWQGEWLRLLVEDRAGTTQAISFSKHKNQESWSYVGLFDRSFFPLFLASKVVDQCRIMAQWPVHRRPRLRISKPGLSKWLGQFEERSREGHGLFFLSSRSSRRFGLGRSHRRDVWLQFSVTDSSGKIDEPLGINQGIKGSI